MRAALILGAAGVVAFGVYALAKGLASKETGPAPAPVTTLPDYRRGGTAQKGPEVIQVDYDPTGPSGGVYVTEV